MNDSSSFLSAPDPCGPDLEYDRAFMAVFIRAAAGQEAQYGAFVAAAPPIDWRAVEQECAALIERSKDLRLGVLFTRCRTRLAGAEGLAEGLALLSRWLTAFAQQIHPRGGAWGDEEGRALRLNALQGLTDPDGLLGDVGELAMSHSAGSTVRLKDLDATSARGDIDRTVVNAIGDAETALTRIEAWATHYLGPDAFDASPLRRILARALPPVAARTVPEAEPPTPLAVPRTTAVSPPHDRARAVEHIRLARQWFECQEPSSPIALLLTQAERLVGKSYLDVIQALPAALREQWAADALNH